MTWFGVVAPKGTPAPVIAKLVQHIHAMQDDPEVQKRWPRRPGGTEGNAGAVRRPHAPRLRALPPDRQGRQFEAGVSGPAAVSRSSKVLVVGGGIAGLTLAVALRRRDVGVDVVELQPRWNILGVGISLTGPTLRALKSIGLIDPCVEVAFGFDRIVFADAAGH